LAHVPRGGAADGRPRSRRDREHELRARALRRGAARPLLRRQGRDRRPHEVARARAGRARRARERGRPRRHRHRSPDRHLAHAGVPRLAAAAAALDARRDRGHGRVPGVGRRELRHRYRALPELGRGDMRVALVTGAATGIGAATADLLERRGLRVARNHLRGQSVPGYSAPADVADPEQVEGMVERVRADLGPVQVLVCNAAHMVMGGIDEVGPDAFWKVIDTNLTGSFNCIRACAPAMADAGFGRIVTIASGWGVTGWPRASAYSASKAGIISMTRPVARPDEVAAMVAHLCSDEAGTITGQVVPVAGGAL